MAEEREKYQAASQEKAGNSSPNENRPAADGDSGSSSSPPQNSERTARRKKRKSFGINQTLRGENESDDDNKEEVDDTAPNPELPKDPFGEQELMNFWTEYLDQCKKAKQQTIYSTLKSCGLKLKENAVVELQLESDAQETNYNEVKPDLLRFLRQKLNNFSLTFEVVKVKTGRVLEPYSPQEKFEYMLKQNPHLMTLKQKLDLDIE